MASFSFDSTAVEPSAPSGPIPAGTYLAHVTESDLKSLKSGNGMGLSLTFVILDGEFVNRRIWTNLNVQHTNATAQQIGQQQLSALCRAVAVPRLQDTTQLHSKPVKITVKIRKQDGYEDKNEITGYEPAVSNGAAPSFTAPAAPAANPAKSAKPWE